MRRPRPLLARISALVALTAGAVLAASGGCGDSLGAPTCSSASPCGSGLWCVYPDGLCGKGSPTGSCNAVSALPCTATQVCGCDGKIYPSACAAAQAGVDSTEPTSCTPPAGTFACGGTYCAAATQLCAEQRALAGNSVCETTVACTALPAACAAAPTCACLASNGFGGTCTGDAASGFAVTAPSGC